MKNNFDKMMYRGIGIFLIYLIILVVVIFPSCKKSRSHGNTSTQQNHTYTVSIRYNLYGDITHYYVADDVFGRDYTLRFYNKYCSTCETYFLKDGSMAVELKLKEGSSYQQVLDKLGNYGERMFTGRGQPLKAYEEKVEENNKFEE